MASSAKFSSPSPSLPGEKSKINLRKETFVSSLEFKSEKKKLYLK